MFNRLSARIAVSEAAAWTGRRWYGGRYEIIPNGVDVDRRPERARSRRPRSCGSLFVGRAEERKGLPILLSAFGALVEHVPCRLTVIGAEREEVLRYLADPETMRYIDVHGRVSGEELWRRAARRRRALRALALRRELRHGPDRGLRRRHAGDRLGDRRLQRRRQRRRRRRPRPAGRPAAPRRGAAARPPRARAPAGDGRGGPRAAPSATPGRGSPTGSPRSTSGRSRRREPVTAGERFAPLGRPAPGRRRPAGAAPAAALARPAAGPRGSRGRRVARRVGARRRRRCSGSA